MTTVALDPDNTAPTSTPPTVKHLWQRGRGLLIGLALLLLGGVLLAAVDSGEPYGRLDPRSADPVGSRAVAQLLKDRGVSVHVVTTLRAARDAARDDTTLLVATPDLLDPAQQRSLRTATDRTGGRTVLIAPGSASAVGLVHGVTAEPGAATAVRTPQCDLAAARRAGSADLGGVRYLGPAARSDSCYPVGGLPTLLRIDTAHGGDTVLLGAPDILYNDKLDKQGNASLAVQLLGSRPHLVWYLPSLDDSTASHGGQKSFFDLIPSGWLWGALQLFVAALLAAAWRARRLGPLVTERLPVAVPASEAAEGRARLYRNANARDRAADVLRAATRERLAPLLGVRPTAAHDTDALLAAVSTRIPHTRLDPSFVLFGPAPTDDAGLIRLADQLDALEREVRTS